MGSSSSRSTSSSSAQGPPMTGHSTSVDSIAPSRTFSIGTARAPTLSATLRMPMVKGPATQPVDPSRQFTIVVLGSPGSGKTALLHRFYNGSFSSIPTPNEAVDVKILSLSLGGDMVEVHLYDTSDPAAVSTIPDVSAAILVTDLSDPASFASLPHYVAKVRSLSPHLVTQKAMVLVSTKSDKLRGIAAGQEGEGAGTDGKGGPKVVSREAVRKYADHVGLQHFETSAREGLGVDDPFRHITTRLLHMVNYPRMHVESLRLPEGVPAVGGGVAAPKYRPAAKTLTEDWEAEIAADEAAERRASSATARSMSAGAGAGAGAAAAAAPRPAPPAPRPKRSLCAIM